MDAYRPERRRRSDSLEQGLDRLVNAGRQLVDGVSGARPGSRPAASRPRLGDLGRWVEHQLDGLLVDDEDWREPWQQRQPEGRTAGRRPLEAISRRETVSRRESSSWREPAPPAAVPPSAGLEGSGVGEDWPDDESFSVPRWRRDPLAGRGPDPLSQPNREATPLPPAGRRPLPRSSRRRAG